MGSEGDGRWAQKVMTRVLAGDSVDYDKGVGRMMARDS